MKTSGIFGTSVTKIVLTPTKKNIKILPFGDVHFGASNHCIDEWDKWIAKAKKDKNAFFVGMGDYFDFMSSSERKAIRNADLHEATRQTFDTVAYKFVRDFCKKIEFMKGRCLGIIEGNHSYEFLSGITSDQKIAEFLGCKCLGVAGLMRLQLEYHGTRSSMHIFAHHGRGAGRRSGSSINSVEDMQSIIDADIYLQGHDHDRWVRPAKAKLYPCYNNKTDELKIKQKVPLLGRTGSFLKAYEPTIASYIVDSLRPPAALGGIEINIGVDKVDNHLVLTMTGTA